MKLLLEDMTRDHLGQVVDIEAAVFTNPWKHRDFEFALKRKNSLCQVVLVEDNVVGYVVGFLIEREFHLADFAITPAFQQKGFGKQALHASFEMLNKKAQVVSLEVRMSNQVAIDLYKELGFETIAIRKAYYTGPCEDALVMLKPLKSQLSDWVSRVLPDALKKQDQA